jgi:rhodanese-related sulfurtransferase
MTTFPLELTGALGHWGAYIVYLIIGIGFGAVLEMSGFGKSTKLAAQFYFKDLTVIKVMFGAIVVAMILIFLASGLGLLDINVLFVNPTFLIPGIVGGLIMGVGFIVGGFCPGTSLVAAATGKLDGIFFVFGGLFGIFLFGETVEYFEEFWYSTDMGRYMVPELLNISTGATVLFITIAAMFVFLASDQLEVIFGDKEKVHIPRWLYGAAAAVVAVAFVVAAVVQPTAEDRWNMIAEEKEALLENREVQIHPAELLASIYDQKLNIYMIDVRDEQNYNLFHIIDSHHVPLNELSDIASDLLLEPPNTVFIVMSNDESAATEAWKSLLSESVPNVYILEGGINTWLDTFADEEFIAEHPLIEVANDEMHYSFDGAFGSNHAVSAPHISHFTLVAEVETEDGEEAQTVAEIVDEHNVLKYTPKVKLELPRGPAASGCG